MRKFFISKIISLLLKNLAIATATESQKWLRSILPFQLVVAKLEIDAVVETGLDTIFEALPYATFATTSNETSWFLQRIRFAYHDFRLVSISGYLSGTCYYSFKGHFWQRSELLFRGGSLNFWIFFWGQTRRHLFTCIFALDY